MSELFRRFFAIFEYFVEVGQIDWCTFSTVERVPVDVKNFFLWVSIAITFLREQAWKDALRKTCAAHNHVVFLVHM